ncbi:hypothetical protein BT96DRAFT_1025282 [Gymnopus androsaceus JB14]|uniref:Ubiquitin 3 binding protein But2 C-terminal domain-containing protein n=1 Tax=Gymnopus androsaceus JB14 TaxID=1447944 RepID=A0A6A4GN10_9AGAR|nr:hypothetical protein BT96DRAFT_1025953 [Gymnopus androsaceus JB14]KAE9388826.1 hypothetical protein BT96DRAFT_1025282 [Gymnopus androsaceus JB14]
MINLYIFRSLEKPQILTFRDVARMRRPNQFIGLERVSDLGTAEPVQIYPNLLSRINKLEPKQTYGDDPIKFAAWGGACCARGPSVPSGFQEFQAIDYEMENCELSLIMPSQQLPGSFNSSLILGHAQNIVNIWRLDHDGYRLDIGSLSWSNRPHRKQFIDSISFPLSFNRTYAFHCPMNSLHAFEFSAGTDTTSVAWSQDYNNSSPGMSTLHYLSASACF